MFKFPIVELVDRYCISKVKFQKLGTNAEEFEYYQQQIQQLDAALIQEELDQLTSLHSEVWDIENEFKDMTVDSKYSLEEIGRRAIYVRNLLHGPRIQLKNRMAEKLNDPVREFKRYGS